MELSEKLKIINQELTIENNILKEKVKEKNTCIEALQEEKQKLREELDSILYSRSYKIMQKVKKVVKRS